MGNIFEMQNDIEKKIAECSIDNFCRSQYEDMRFTKPQKDKESRSFEDGPVGEIVWL